MEPGAVVAGDATHEAARAYARALAAAKVAGIPARFHVLRHSVASAMLANGAVSIRTASENLGHATTSLTADLYAHVAQDEKVPALRIVDAAFGGGAS